MSEALYDVGSMELASGQSRTFWDGSVVVQLSAKEDHVTAIASTQYHPKNQGSAVPEPLVSFEAALSLYWGYFPSGPEGKPDPHSYRSRAATF